MPIKIHFILPYTERTAPSQRFRVEAYYSILDARGVNYKAGHFWNKNSSLTLYKKGKAWLKVFYVCRGFLLRAWDTLANISRADYVFIHREAAPLGPPVFEWFIAKVLRRKIIYDFDDAIWIPGISANNKIAFSLKAFWKVKYICRWAHKVSAGNDYLANWARQHNSNVVYNPTCVDMQNRYKVLKNQATEKLVIGWTGSHSTLKYLDLIKPVLAELESEFEFEFLVICDKEPEWKMKSLRFIAWNEASEIKDLLKINIGIMPLEKDAWSEGKCGFKLIQYLSLGIPAVASPVGVNKRIIHHGKNGYACTEHAEWKAALARLLKDESLRKAMGFAGREKMLKEYSVQSNTENFISLFS